MHYKKYSSLIDLKTLDRPGLEEFFRQLDQPTYRARQVMGWIYRKGVEEFARMTDLGSRLRGLLEENARISQLALLDRRTASDRETEKFLFGLEDGLRVETVLMRYSEDLGPDRMTVCVSTQVGCALGCRFCASGLGGLVRNLNSVEILDQVLQVQRLIAENGERVANVVLMGMGEPLANYFHSLAALRRLNARDGPAIGIRRLTVSTAGLVSGINKLAREGLTLRLAISLHAADDRLRSELMPINDRFPLDQLLSACRDYQAALGRRITIEYLLLREVNDRKEDAVRLAQVLKGLHAMVNLIPYNPVTEFAWKRPDRKRQQSFLEVLRQRNQPATLRTERGLDLDAACGQLRLRSSA